MIYTTGGTCVPPEFKRVTFQTMLAQWIRVLYSDNGTLTDYSLALQRGGGKMNAAIVASEDAIYLGQYFPFNNFFVQVDTANAKLSQMQIAYWDGSIFRSAVDLLDATALNGKSLSQNGVVQFQPSRDGAWQVISNPATDAPVLLNTMTIEDLYWLKISFTGDLSLATKISELSYAFCRDEDLLSVDPEINDYLSAWQQTNWIKQILMGSQNVIADLKARGLVKNNGQVLRFDDVFWATVYKTLDIIFTPMGKNFVDKRKDYQKKYSEFIQGPRFTLDQSNDGRVERAEIQNSTHMGVR